MVEQRPLKPFVVGSNPTALTKICIPRKSYAEVEKLVDSQSSEGCSCKGVWVQVPPSAPKILLAIFLGQRKYERIYASISLNRQRAKLFDESRIITTSKKI